MENKNLFRCNPPVNKQLRRKINGHGSFIIWLTGLSGSGKSTIASELERYLFNIGIHTYLLDGDNIRLGINSDLGFTEQDRRENIRRVGEIAKILVDAGLVVIVALISPYERERQLARNLMDTNEFIEIYIKCPLEVCIQRDPKGLYRKAKEKSIPMFTGFDSPYEEPNCPDLIVPTDQLSIAESTQQIIAYLRSRITTINITDLERN